MRLCPTACLIQTFVLVPALSVAGPPPAAGARFAAQRAEKDFMTTADPNAPHWRKAKIVKAAVDPNGAPAAAGNAFEFRALWTSTSLYFLFSCPYESLSLKPDPSTTTETNKLWEFDVTEVFVGADMENIHRYQEFQVSPQGEWVDLDIDRKNPLPQGGWRWDSGMRVAARIDKAKKVWYGEMKIPIEAIDKKSPKAGTEYRINIYRLTGLAPNRVSTMWTPTRNRSHHTPEAFGRMVLGQ